MRKGGQLSPLKSKTNSSKHKPLPPTPPEKPERVSRPVPIKSSSENSAAKSPKSPHHHLRIEENKDDIELGTEQTRSSSEAASRITSSASATSVDTKGSKSSSNAASLSDKKKPNRFKGVNPLQYALFAHNMAYGAAAMCICMGIFAMLWTSASTYRCKINGNDLINPVYLYNTTTNTCPTTFTINGKTKSLCCNHPYKDSSLEGYLEIGVIYFIYGILMLFYENTNWGFGLYFPNDSFLYRSRISVIGILHIIIGGIGCYNYATCLAGSFLIFSGLTYCYAVKRNESGDGGREVRHKANEAEVARKKKAIEKGEAKDENKNSKQKCLEFFWYLLSYNPISFYRRIYNEDKLSSYFWISIFVIANVITFIYTLNVWFGVIADQKEGLRNGNLNVFCNSPECHVNRKIVRYGPVSVFAPFAKACGMCLNLNGALLLLPVVRLLLRKINNYGESFFAKQQQSDFFSKFFAHPMTRYLPLQKNIEFHKICAITIFFFAWFHMIFHWLNLWKANNQTLRLFRFWGWDGTDYFTGALVSLAMFFIFSGAPDTIRLSKYEIFFKSHHFFILFYIAMFIHGPIFFYWTAVPVLLYILERYLQLSRGNRPYVILKVEWIPPVMAVYFRPIFKDDFIFKEGQYLYINAPSISPSEWHPFTISSASDDMNNGIRIHLETGEEVMEVPRPKNLPSNAKWNKYCLLSQDYTTMDPNEYLDKSETSYFDYISVHIKVHGLEEPHARSWTRKLKEYFELMSPGKKFPFYFSKRDSRGEIMMGRQYGPDGKTQILRIDGPQSAPAEHYAHYGTLMLIGAGIGLTPCVSILTSLTKYRWKKNFNPELLHFYWIVRQNEIDSFQWLIHMLTDISYELKKSRLNYQIERRYYCEINIFITGVEKDKPITAPPLYRAKKRFVNSSITPTFTADELYAKMLNPTITSKDMIKKMKNSSSETVTDNRLQDIWIWNGRPNWDEIFAHMKDQRQHSDIGVCFCGAPVIGADLRTMCEKYSNAKEDCLFSLHKENF
jgi:hypothetical protein